MKTSVTAWRALPRTVWQLVLARTVNRLGAFTLPFLSVTLVSSFGASVVDAGYLLAMSDDSRLDRRWTI